MMDMDMLKNEDFMMTFDQLEKLNKLISDSAQRNSVDSDDQSDGLSVTMEFSPFGRSIFLRCDGGPIFEII